MSLTLVDLKVVELLHNSLTTKDSGSSLLNNFARCYDYIETSQAEYNHYQLEKNSDGVNICVEGTQHASHHHSSHGSGDKHTARGTTEEFVEQFYRSLSAVLCTVDIKPSSFLGVYIRKVNVTAQQTQLKHWSALQVCWVNNHRFLHSHCTQAAGALIYGQTAIEKTFDIPNHVSSSPVGSNGPILHRLSHEYRGRASSDRSVWSSYTSYTTEWRSGEYSNAVEQLHRHFDYLPQKFERLNHHYAVLELALLLVDAGSEREALWAICEAIDAARDNHDDDCLAFALEWLRSMSQHDLCVSKVYFNLLSRQRRAHTMGISYDPRICTVEPTQCSVQSPTVAGRLVKLRSIERTRSNSTYRRLALVDSWSDLDLEQLKNISLRLALAESLRNVETEAAVRVRCAVAVTVFSTGDTARARRILDAMPRSAMQNHKLHKIWLTQHAIFRLAQGSELEEDLLLELQEIRRDPMTIGPRVRRLIAKNLLVEAKDLLEGYLKPSFAIASTHAGSRRRILSLQLSSEIYLKSSEPDRALIAVVHAIKLAHKESLYKVYRELMESMSSIAELLEK